MAMRQLLFVRDRNLLILLLLSWLLVWPSAARGADQIRVGYGSLSTSYAAIWVAGEAGLFRKNGINAEVLYLESALVRTGLIAGDIATASLLYNRIVQMTRPNDRLLVQEVTKDTAWNRLRISDDEFRQILNKQARS